MSAASIPPIVRRRRARRKLPRRPV